MCEHRSIMAVVSDSAEKELWLPVFNLVQEQVVLVELSEVSRLLTEFQSSGDLPYLMFVSARVYPEENPKLVTQLRTVFPAMEVVVMALSTDPPPRLATLLEDKVVHLLVNPVGNTGDDLKRTSDLFELALRRLVLGETLSMADYLTPGAAVYERRISSSNQKEHIIAELEHSIAGCTPEYEMLRMKGALLADEMLENALYAAPRDGISGPLYRKGEKRMLTERDNVVFRFGFDGDLLALEVSDGWGTLTPEAFLEHVSRNLEGSCMQDEIGGRGLFIIWRFLDSLHLRISPGKQTVIGGHVRLASDVMFSESKGLYINTAP